MVLIILVVYVVAERLAAMIENDGEMRRPVGVVQILGELPEHRRIAINRADGPAIRVRQRRQAVIGAGDVAGAIAQIEMILLGHGARVSRGSEESRVGKKWGSRCNT